MKTYILILFSILTLSLAAQRSIIFIHPSSIDSTTKWWDKHQTTEPARVGMPNVYDATDSMRFRITGNYQAVEIWTNDYITFNGRVASYIFKDNVDGEKCKKVVPLDTVTARCIYKLFADSNVFSIPDMTYFPSWQGFFCMGETFNLEYTTPKGYSFKSYVNPGSQGIKEGNTISHVLSTMYRYANAEDAWTDFTAGLEPGTYTYNNASRIAISKYSVREDKKILKNKKHTN